MNKPSYKELEKRVAFLEQEIKTKLRQKDVLIQDINKGVAAKTGESFFETIVLKLSKALRSDYTFVGKLLPDENKVETISLCVDNSIVDNFSYDIKGTPCENVIGAKICTYAANVFSSFPDDLLLRDMEVEGYVGTPLFNSQNKPLGIMVALFKNEIEDASYVEQIMEIFSGRTGAELERYATEEALRESEIIFKSIFHNSGIGIALVNLDGKIIKANRTVEKLYSDKIGELTGKNFTDIVHHDDAEETKVQFMKIVSGEIDEIKTESKYVSKNGTEVLVNLNATVVKDYNGSPIHIVTFIEDITERKLATKKLKQSEQKLAFHFEETPIGVIEWNSNFEVVLWNKAAEKIFGYSKEEAIGRHSIGFIIPEKTWPEIEKIWDSLSGKTDSIRNINENLTKEGKTILCDWYNTAMIDEQGNTIGMASMVIDITEQKQIEDQLKKLTTAVEQSANTVVITDLEGNIEYVNKKFTETTGYSYKEAIGQNPRILKTDFQPSEIYQKLWKTITNGKTWQGEFLNKKKNGDLFWEKATITPVKSDQGDIINYLAIKEDITELRKNQEELIQAGEIWQNIQTGLYIYHLEDIEDDTTLRMIAANPASEILTGIKTRNVLGKTLDENFPGLREKGIPQKYAEVVRTKNNIRFEDQVYGDDRVLQRAFSVEAFLLPGNKIGVSFENISERKRTEEKLKKSEQRLSIHIEETHVGVIEWNLDFEVVSWNKAAENIFGYSKEEAIGVHTVGLIVPKSGIEKIDVVWDALINQTGGEKSINENVTKEGNTILCEWHNTTLVDEKGNTIGVASLVQDITEQKRIEKELRESEEKHKYISKISSDYVYSIRLDRNDKYMIEWVSGAFERITGYTIKEINGMENRWEKIIYPEDLKRLNQEHRNIRELKLSATDEYRIITKRGTVKWLSDSYVQVNNPKTKRIQTIYGSVKDITDKKLAEEALKDSEHLLRESQKVAKMGSYVLDVTNGIWQSSAILDKMFGIDKRYNKGVSGWLQIIHPKDRAMMQDYFTTNVLKNKEPFNKEYRIKRINDQREYWIHGMGKLEFNNDGNPIKMIGTIQDITERKQTEELLTVQRQRQANILEGTNAGTWDWSVQTGQLILNERWAEIIGYTLEELGPIDINTWINNVHPEDLPIANTLLDKHFNRKSNYYDVEFRQPHKNGKWIWVNARGKVIEWTEDGKPLRMSGTHLDITNRKQAEEELRKQHYYLEKAEEIGNTGTWELDLMRNKLFWSNQNYSIFRIPIGTPLTFEIFLDCVHPDDREYVNAQWLASLDGKPFDIEHRLLIDGKVKWVSEKAELIFDEKNKALRAIGFTQDITERKQIHTRLINSEQRFRQITENAQEWIWEVDSNGLYTFGSQIMEKMFGYKNEEIVGKKHFYDLFHPEDLEGLKNAALKVFKQKQPFYEFINRNITKDGEIIWLSTSGVPILDNDGNLLGYRGADINITKRRLAEEAVLISEKKFSKIFELNPEITWIVKEESRVIVDVNHTLTDILGYSKEEIVGKTAKELDIWQNLEDREQLFEEYEINKGFARVESKLKTKNGQILNVDILARRIEFDDTFHLMAIIRDITELRKSEEKIKKNNEEMITLNKQIAEYKMMALRSVMNPHFIFNCLNSIQFFILKNEKKSAIDYLSLFSKLIRNVLNSSVNRYTTLEMEVETLKYYVELEKLRFDDKFQFILSLDDNIDADEIEIPSLIIQPYIENAIIHGLTNKEGQGTLRLEIKELNDKLLCIIEDDGIGREKSENLKIHRNKDHKSVGMTVTEERLDIINRTNDVSVNIIDLEVNGMANGTKVELLINIEKR